MICHVDLPRKADVIDETQSKMVMAKGNCFASSCCLINSASTPPIASKRPRDAQTSTSTKRPAKNKSESHSTCVFNDSKEQKYCEVCNSMKMKLTTYAHTMDIMWISK